MSEEESYLIELIHQIDEEANQRKAPLVDRLIAIRSMNSKPDPIILSKDQLKLLRINN